MSLSENGEIAIGSFDNFLDMSDDERQLYILKYYKEKYNELVGVYQDEIDILTILFRDFNKPNLSGYNIEGLHTDFHPYGYNVGGLYCNYHSISEGSSTESGYFYFY